MLPRMTSGAFRITLLCGTLLCVSATARAADIYKCATPTGISYQSAPCQGVELPKPLIVGNVVEAPRRTTGGAAVEALRSTGSPATDSSTDSGAVSFAAPGAGASASRDCNARPREWWRLAPLRRAICIGMSDDEVLNLPGWGRPAKIVRTRAPREWREEWIYDARYAGPRQLWFVNGKLAAVETDLIEAPSGALARVAVNSATN